MNLFEATSIHKTYEAANGQKLHALDGFDLSLQEGRFTVLFGPSGCGKSTFLRLLSKLDQSYEGSIRWSTKPRIGFIFQKPHLLPWRTVKDNILLSRGEGFSDQDYEQLVTQLGLDHLQDSFPRELSLGLERRVAIARAFAFKPNLLLLDEPFVSLDAPTAEAMQNLVRELWQREKVTSLMVTHDMREAIRLAQDIVFMTPRPGRLLDVVHIAEGDRMSEESVERKRASLKQAYPQLFEGR